MLPDDYAAPPVGDIDRVVAAMGRLYQYCMEPINGFVCTLPLGHAYPRHVGHAWDCRVVAVNLPDPLLRLPEGF